MVELVVKSKIKDAVKGKRVAGDLAEALNKKIEEILKAAAARAERNGRGTVMPHDL